jgi:hypothetical protein
MADSDPSSTRLLIGPIHVAVVGGSPMVKCVECVPVVSPSQQVSDCPECRGARTVILGTYSVCLAEFFEDNDDLQPGWDVPTSPVARSPPMNEQG